nr:metallophosphoesterase [Actinomycetota bacterium]
MVATIFHLSDLHLHVDADGFLRSDETRLGRLRERVAERFAGLPLLEGTAVHDVHALAMLRRDLRLWIERERAEHDAPIVVAQTGDVEALGGIPGDADDWREAFPSWAFLHDEAEGCGSDWVHLFGNHDTWPGVFPLAAFDRTVNRERIADVPLLAGDWNEPIAIDGLGGIRVVIARVNTVPRDFRRELFASGRLTALPPADDSVAALLEELREAFEPYDGGRVVRIALMHHPPHAFAAGRLAQLTNAHFHGAQEVADALRDARVQLVVAGHRHALDPPLGTQRYGFSQRPLDAPTVQLVAESPTQR